MQVSHSRVECFEGCPYRYKLRYIDNYETLKPDNADNPLFLGTALHTGIEKDVNTAIKEYFAQYPIITDEHINEAIKLEYQIPRVKNILPQGDYEVQIKDEDFIGFIDLLVPIKDELTMDEKDEICDNCEKNCDCNYALIHIFPKIDLDKIKNLFDDIPLEYNGLTILSPQQRKLYFKSLEYKYETVLKPTYNKLKSLNK